MSRRFLQLRTGLTYSLAASVEDSLKTGVPNGGYLAKYIETLFGLSRALLDF